MPKLARIRGAARLVADGAPPRPFFLLPFLPPRRANRADVSCYPAPYVPAPSFSLSQPTHLPTTPTLDRRFSPPELCSFARSRPPITLGYKQPSKIWLLVLVEVHSGQAKPGRPKVQLARRPVRVSPFLPPLHSTSSYPSFFSLFSLILPLRSLSFYPISSGITQLPQP